MSRQTPLRVSKRDARKPRRARKSRRNVMASRGVCDIEYGIRGQTETFRSALPSVQKQDEDVAKKELRVQTDPRPKIISFSVVNLFRLDSSDFGDVNDLLV